MMKKLPHIDIHDINENIVFVDFLDKNKKIIDSQLFHFLSGVKDFTKIVNKDQKGEKFLEKMANDLNDFSNESTFLPYEINITNSILCYDKKHCPSLSKIFNQNQGEKTFQDINFLNFNEGNKNEKKLNLDQIKKSEFFKNIKNSLCTQVLQHGEKINLNSSFLIMDKLKEVPFACITLLLIAYLSNQKEKNSYETLILNQKNLRLVVSMVKDHLIKSYKLFGCKSRKRVLFCLPSSSSQGVFLSRDCHKPYKPVFKFNSKIQAIFERVGFVSNLVKKFEKKKLMAVRKKRQEELESVFRLKEILKINLLKFLL